MEEGSSRLLSLFFFLIFFQNVLQILFIGQFSVCFLYTKQQNCGAIPVIIQKSHLTSVIDHNCRKTGVGQHGGQVEVGWGRLDRGGVVVGCHAGAA